jgi:uncharacterized protein
LTAAPNGDLSSLDIRDGGGFCLIRVRLTPKASSNEITGVGEGALRLRIQAPPVDGAANEKAREFLAECLGISRGAVSLERGQTSREKVFKIAGLRPEAIRALLRPVL